MNKTTLSILFISIWKVCAFSTTFSRNTLPVPKVGITSLIPTATSTTSLYSIQEERRTFLSKIPAGLASIVAITTSVPTTAGATLMDTNVKQTKTSKLGENLTTEQAKKRLLEAMADVDELIENYSEISKGGGDAVRRYLGTVGVDKKMYGITKVVKSLRDEADDIVEYTESANEFEAYLYQAEGAAYQSLFIEHSSAKGTPETFLATAKKDVVSMRKFMGDLALQLSL